MQSLKSAHIPALSAVLSMKLTFDPLQALQFVGVLCWEEEAARADTAGPAQVGAALLQQLRPGRGEAEQAGRRSNSAAALGPFLQGASKEGGAGREGGEQMKREGGWMGGWMKERPTKNYFTRSHPIRQQHAPH